MANDEPKVRCETPSAGKQGTRIAKWKYDAVRAAIRKVVPRSKEGVEFRKLAKQVADVLPAATRNKIGSISWYTVTVKLDMEVRGELARVEGSKPQRIRRVK